MPKFVLKDMEGLYIEEMNAAINLLKVYCTVQSSPRPIG
jgi:hypothetical protein